MFSQPVFRLFSLILSPNHGKREDEGRRYLMMEQEEAGAHCGGDNCPGAIDITALHSPTSSDGQTSGYGSADDEHLSSPGLSPSMRNNKTQPFGDQSSLLSEIDFNNGFIDATFANPSAVADNQNSFHKVSATQPLGVQVNNNNGMTAMGGIVSPSQVSPAPAMCSPSRSTGFTMNDNFDTGDIEMNDTSSPENNCTTNITVTLPSNVNLHGHDEKSLLLSILKNADKSELLKLNTQLSQVLATIQAQGGKSGQPNIHISIESEPQSQTAAISAPVSCTSSTGSKPKEDIGSNLASVLENPESLFSMSPGETLMDTYDILTPSTSGNSENVMAQTSSPSFVNSASNANNVNQKMNDSMATIFSDGFSQYCDDFNIQETNSNVTDQLLNDVVFGPNTPPTVQPSMTVNSQSFTTMQTSESLSMATPTPLSSPAKAQAPAIKSLKQKAVVKPTVQMRSNNTNNNTLLSQQKNSQKHQHQIDMAAAKRGLDDHSYFCTPSHKTNGHVKFAPESKTQRRPDGTLLEHFLTTKDPINPMRGSDYVAHGISKLHFEESQGLKPNLLKQLLTGDVGRKDCVHRLQASSASSSSLPQVRKTQSTTGTTKANSVSSMSSNTSATMSSSSSNSTMATNTTSSSSSSSVIPGPVDNDLGFHVPGLADLDMLGTATDLDSLWTDDGKQDEDILFSSEIDEILEQEDRHGEEWMKELFNML